MSSSTFPSIYKYFMERKSHEESIDGLATVRAAAWAWYQHGAGSEGRPMREYDLSKIYRAPKPTRYKLEAMKTDEEVTGRSRSMSPKSSPSHLDNSLLDTYEIERISTQLDYYIESSSRLNEGNNHGDNRRVVSSSSKNETTEFRNKSKSKNKNEKGKGFWARRRVICGSKDDVVESRGHFGGGRLPEKGVPVVRVANCRPRATHA